MASTTQDVGLLTRKLGAADYDPTRYVAEISQRCVGGEEVVARRKVIQSLSDDTNNQLKKNVYQNYNQFIETAKEISHLENDMYRLSHMITEQRKMLTGLLDTSLLGDAVPLSHTALEPALPEPQPDQQEAAQPSNTAEQGRRDLLALMENVEGGRDVIDVQTRFVLHHGDLVEMDTADNSALHRVHGYLCNDCLVVATWLREKRGPVRFKLSSVYPSSAIALVNVRDLAGIRHAWKLLVSPEPRLFQCKDAASKKEWLAAYDEAKNIQKKGGLATKPKPFERVKSVRPKKEEPLNPFDDDEFESEPEDGESGSCETALPEWLAEMPDTLEVFTAQREFEQAVELLVEAGPELARLPAELRAAADARREQLVAALRAELKVTPDKSLQGGPRTARRAVGLLCSLARADEARDLLLAHRTALLRHTVKNVRPEGSTVLYVQRLATAFFHQLTESSREFDKCFSGAGPTRASSLLQWAEEEVEWFADRLDKQVFNSQSPISVVAACVSFLRAQSERLVTAGLDVLFMLDSRLQASIEKVIMEARDKAVEAVKLRWAEESWAPHQCSSRAGLERTLAELASVGVANMGSYSSSEGNSLQLTTNTVSFCLAYLQLVEQLLQLFSPGSRHLVNESLVSVLHAQLRHLEQAGKAEVEDPAFVAKNAAFLLDTVLTLAEHRYQEKTQTECPKLAKLHSNYSWMKDGKTAVAKYTDPNYV